MPPALASDPIVVQDLAFSYPRATPLFSQTYFNIKPREFVALIGPNGGGKTTLLKLLLGLEKPDAGLISICGKPIDKARGLIGYVPQKLPFDRQFPISVFEVVLTGRLAHLPWYGRYREIDAQAAMQALETVGLTDYAQQPFGALSGGQAQRTLLARALAGNPSILLLDEPTSHIDLASQQTLYALLSALKTRMTLVMVTHDLNAIFEQVDRVLCVQRGVSVLRREEVCQHVALGLYHPAMPLNSAPN